MRILWFVIMLIVIAAAVLLSVSPDGSRPKAPAPAAPEVEPTTEPPGPVATPQVAPEPETTTTRLDERTEDTAATHDGDTPSELALELTEAAERRAAEAKAEADVLKSDARPPAPDEIAGPELEDGLDVEIAHATVKAGRIKRIAPDELAVDGEWTLRGRGTREDPYQPTWEYLFSAADTYQPRLDENEIPQRIALLNDTWVRIAGYTAFPLVAGESKEMLVMLNKWDGCCIGVPPTPFDAIEVHLTEAVARGPKHAINFGAVTGRLKVDPYLIENWLVGLYILEEASIDQDI